MMGQYIHRSSDDTEKYNRLLPVDKECVHSMGKILNSDKAKKKSH